MNQYQELWWRQARSDHDMFVLMRSHGAPHCQSLHYLQMVTEKIAKAYFWRSGSPPPMKHAGFVQFLRFLGQIRRSEQERIAKLFTFSRFDSFRNGIRAMLPIAYDLERLAPTLATDGPNPEYPWPHRTPQYAPADYNFPIWGSLQTGRGNNLLRVIRIAVVEFPHYADV